VNESLERELKELRADYRAGLPARLARLRALLADAGGMGALRRELHKIAGSAKTFGLPAATEAARAAEAYLLARSDPDAAPSAAERAQLAALLDKLAQAI
jgi:HPt (histidine-containing phosphotransfer) domain-containing protein